ncbi:unnamed protein product [Miscanthus lutarioriparius]|uniref:Uncharacterized protein n=1 Tax=Miscanthus lutarioriparius TaxID=422564 RepID=A0A811N6J6_9POAL|nr:unnamed protein product [Miscanthus lutarioriparius]
MASQAMECHRASAEVFTGDATCRKKSVELLEELGLPKGLLPLEDIQEFGYNRDSGFIWLVQGKKVEHTFKKIMQKVSYDTEVTAFIENSKLRKVTGIKTNAMMLWISINEVFVPEALPEKVTFKSGNGLSRTFDAAAFALGE